MSLQFFMVHGCAILSFFLKRNACLSVVVLFFCTRVHFEEMCVDILARVEPPLHNLLENAS